MGQKLLQHKHADVEHPTAPADQARVADWEDRSLHCCTWGGGKKGWLWEKHFV